MATSTNILPAPAFSLSLLRTRPTPAIWPKLTVPVSVPNGIDRSKTSVVPSVTLLSKVADELPRLVAMEPTDTLANAATCNILVVLLVAKLPVRVKVRVEPARFNIGLATLTSSAVLSPTIVAPLLRMGSPLLTS